MADEERGEWAADVLDRIRLYQRYERSGLFAMMHEGLLDVFDALAIAPLMLIEEKRLTEMASFERRRLKRFEQYVVD